LGQVCQSLTGLGGERFECVAGLLQSAARFAIRAGFEGGDAAEKACADIKFGVAWIIR